MNQEKITAAFLVIGDEILSGRTIDKNINFLAVELGKIGINLKEVRVVPDIEIEIIDAINILRKKFNYVFTSGGIGPTHDDITSLSVAKAFGEELIQNQEATEILIKYYGKENVNEARLKMAFVPKSAKLLDNPVSSAPGFRVENVFVMAGVPKIFQAMFEATKKEVSGGKITKSKEIKINITESIVAKELSQMQLNYPEIAIGSYPFEGGTSLVFRATDENILDNSVNEMVAVLKKINDDMEINIF